MAGSRLRRELQEVEARLLEHLAVLRVEEAQAVLVDHLHLDSLPLLPALGADRLHDPVLDRGGEADAPPRRRFRLTPAPHAGHRHLPKHSIIPHAIMATSWKSPRRPAVLPTSTSPPRPWPAWTRWATARPPKSSRRRCPGPSRARTSSCSPAPEPERRPPSASPSSRRSTPPPSTSRRWRWPPLASWRSRSPGSCWRS